MEINEKFLKEENYFKEEESKETDEFIKFEFNKISEAFIRKYERFSERIHTGLAKKERTLTSGILARKFYSHESSKKSSPTSKLTF